MNEAIKVEIDKAVRAIKQSMQLQKIYLFASHAVYALLPRYMA